MKKYILILLAFLSFIPSIPYLCEAWRSSRLDSWDWVFYLLTIPAVVWAMNKNRMEKWNYKAILIVVMALILISTKSFHNVNALSIVGSAVFVWGVAFVVCGWNFAYRLLPCLLIILLGTPSSSYRLAQLFSLSTATAMMLKILIAVVGFIWIYVNKRFGKVVKFESILFIGVVLLSSAILLHADELYFSGKSNISSFPKQVGDFWGREIEADDNTKKFFATSQVRQYRYVNDEQEISILAVKCGNNVHEIHPASHCLRTSRWVVNSEKIHLLRHDFAVTEIEANKANTKFLIWVWYSNYEFSTPGFLGFRRRFRPNGNFYTFQISVPVRSDVETARKFLQEFISVLPQERKK